MVIPEYISGTEKSETNPGLSFKLVSCTAYCGGFYQGDNTFDLSAGHARPDRQRNDPLETLQGFRKIHRTEIIPVFVIGHSMKGYKMHRNPDTPLLKFFNDSIPGKGKMRKV
jgi:hypothetical protein